MGGYQSTSEIKGTVLFLRSKELWREDDRENEAVNFRAEKTI